MIALIFAMFASLVLLGWSVFTQGYIARDFAEALLVLSAALTCALWCLESFERKRA